MKSLFIAVVVFCVVMTTTVDATECTVKAPGNTLSGMQLKGTCAFKCPDTLRQARQTDVVGSPCPVMLPNCCIPHTPLSAHVADLFSGAASKSVGGNNKNKGAKTTGSPSPVPPQTAEYTVKSGDSFSRIAATLQICQADITRLNPGVTNDSIRPGQKLVVPGAPTRERTRPFSELGPVSENDKDIVAKTLWGEARGEPEEGRIAIIWTLINRALNPHYPRTLAAVCQQPSQYSVWNHPASAMTSLDSSNALYTEYRALLDAVLAGRHPDNTQGATHYYAPAKISAPSWASQGQHTVTIDGHMFYKGITPDVKSC